MSFCGENPSDPHCVCLGTDAYHYKIFSPDTHTFHCCNIIPAPLLDGNTYADNRSYLTALMSASSGTHFDGVCNDFFNALPLSDADFKLQYPELYNIVTTDRLLSNGLQTKPIYTSNTITCSSPEVAYYISYYNSVNTRNFFTVCHSGDLPNIQNVEYTAYRIRNEDGTLCNSVCNTEYPEWHPYNMDVPIYESDTVQFSKSVAGKWWFWLIILVVIVIAIIIIRQIVISNHEKRLKNTKDAIHITKHGAKHIHHAKNVEHLIDTSTF